MSGGFPARGCRAYCALPAGKASSILRTSRRVDLLGWLALYAVARTQNSLLTHDISRFFLSITHKNAPDRAYCPECPSQDKKPPQKQQKHQAGDAERPHDDGVDNIDTKGNAYVGTKPVDEE